MKHALMTVVSNNGHFYVDTGNLFEKSSFLHNFNEIGYDLKQLAVQTKLGLVRHLMFDLEREREKPTTIMCITRYLLL